jgi:predicted transcriptional regulator
MSRALGETPQRRFQTVLPDDLIAARLHRYSIDNSVARNDVVVEAIMAYLNRGTARHDIGDLSSEVTDELDRFCAAHFGGDKNQVIEAAIRAFIKSELIRDAATRERFLATPAAEQAGMLRFARSIADKPKEEG